MSNLSDIKRRIASVKQTRQITGAMETVSVAKMRKAIERLDSSRAYSDMMKDIMLDVNADELFERKLGGKKLVMVISSDRGLCGGFDHDIFKLADECIDANTVVMPIGKTACDRYRSHDAADMRLGKLNIAEYGNAARIADELIAMYGNGVSEICAVYSSLVSRASYRPMSIGILPLSEASISQSSDGKKRMAIDHFEPDRSAVAKQLLPLYLADRIYFILADSAAAEHCARRAMMSAATESADEIIGRLSVEYNRSRQSVITEQIVEISGSTEALKKQVEK